VPVQYSYTSTPLSACTVQLYLYSPQFLYSTAIPLLPSVPVQHTYTSIPPIGRTAYTEPQCLYSTAIPLLPLWPYGLYRASVPVQGCTLALSSSSRTRQTRHSVLVTILRVSSISNHFVVSKPPNDLRRKVYERHRLFDVRTRFC